jgi:AAA15 family ATPase/GTPase
VINSLSLENFRGFRQLELTNLARVNLIGGVNNAGKTALLEAIYLFAEHDHSRLQALPQLFRPGSGVNDDRYFWQWLAYDKSGRADTIISGDVQGLGAWFVSWYSIPSQRQRQGQIVLRHANRELLIPALGPELALRWPKPQVFTPAPTKPIDDAQLYIRAAKKTPDAEERIESLLREIEPRLKRVRAFPDEQTNQPLIHIGLTEGEALPANQLGQGFNRLLNIYSALISAEAKIFLIDEIETGLHHSVLPLFWRGLAAMARQEDVQIFATTHSREAIFDAHRVFDAEPQYGFAYHRLERIDGKIHALTYDKTRLDGADEHNFEVR